MAKRTVVEPVMAHTRWSIWPVGLRCAQPPTSEQQPVIANDPYTALAPTETGRQATFAIVQLSLWI